VTNRLDIAIDIGITGCLAAFADGEPVRLIDMPTRPRDAGGSEVDGYRLAALLRGLRQEHPGAYVQAVIERVYARPARFGGEGGAPGVASSGKLMQSDGMVRGVIEGANIPIVNVQPQTWKRHHGLLGTEKDAARLLAIKLYTHVAQWLVRKKDIGRADAILIGAWAVATDQVARAA
jgi:hypothetical protein